MLVGNACNQASVALNRPGIPLDMKRERDPSNPSVFAEFKARQTLQFRYKNWQGAVGERSAEFIGILYGTSEWHHEPQWLIKAIDTEKGSVRLFALRDMVPL
jgi:predicted DNA-binding transcriptional regulator YafY